MSVGGEDVPDELSDECVCGNHRNDSNDSTVVFTAMIETTLDICTGNTIKYYLRSVLQLFSVI